MDINLKVNNFAEIIPLAKYDRVAYYSVSINGSKTTLFELFLNKHTNENYNKLRHIVKWIKEIGDKYGAKSYYFRNEAYDADTSALPPKGKKRKPLYIESEPEIANNLRLYCFRANDYVVFLFGGDIKTKNKAQDCPNVKSHFMLANKLTKSIDNAFKNKDIRWIKDDTLIEIDAGFKLYFD